MALQRHKISLWVLKNMWVSAPFKLFMMNLKLKSAAQRRFVFIECYVVKLLLCVASLSWMFSTLLDYSWIINCMFTFQHESAVLHQLLKLGAIHPTKIPTCPTGFFETFPVGRTDPLRFGPKFLEILVEWIAPIKYVEKLLFAFLEFSRTLC